MASSPVFSRLRHGIRNRIVKDRLSLWGRLLIPLSRLYQAVTRLRTILYARGIFTSRTLPCPVISIGNITVGGTGKTPMAVYLAGLIRQTGKTPVIVSRGYRGRRSRSGGIVSDGRTCFMTADECGDEPFMIASGTDIPVVIGRDRYRAGCLAWETFKPDVIILDDGFQHLKLRRNLDIVLMDCRRPLGSNRLLPAGPLRESLDSGMKRAGMVIFTRCPRNRPPDGEFSRKIAALAQKTIPVFHSFHTPCLYRFIEKTGTVSDKTMAGLKGLNALAFSGIAENRVFFHTLEESGVLVMSHLEFDDHYRYKEKDLNKIEQTAGRLNADIIATTEKDFARISGSRAWKMDLAVIGIRIQLAGREDELKMTITQVTDA